MAAQGLSGIDRVLDLRVETEGLLVWASPSLPCALEQLRHIKPCLVLVQPRETCPEITVQKIVDWDVMIWNQIKQPIVLTPCLWEHTGSVVECLTQDRGAVNSSLTGVAV